MFKSYFKTFFAGYIKYAKIVLVASCVWYGLATAVALGIVAASLLEPMVEQVSPIRLPMTDPACQMSPQLKKIIELARRDRIGSLDAANKVQGN